MEKNTFLAMKFLMPVENYSSSSGSFRT